MTKEPREFEPCRNLSSFFISTPPVADVTTFPPLPPTLRPRSIIPPVFHPEYGRYMLESTPGAPYTGCVRDLLLVESNMRLRWVTARLLLPPGSSVLRQKKG